MREAELELIHHLRQKWIAWGIRLDDPPAIGSVVELWKKAGMQAPHWLTHLLITTGGMIDLDATPSGFHLWNLSEIEKHGLIQSADRSFCLFADQDMGAWFFAVADDLAVYSIDLEKRFSIAFGTASDFLSSLERDQVYNVLVDNFAN